MLPDGIVPRCVDALWNTEDQIWHLLLDDLTDSNIIATQ
jgi:hypothetical protein